MAFVLLFVPTTMSSAFADNEVAPAPPSIGASVPLTYFGPSPSMVHTVRDMSSRIEITYVLWDIEGNDRASERDCKKPNRV
jgi:hypothetical protein